MAADYSDLAGLVNASAFQDHVAVAVTKFAQFIIGEDPAVALHASRAAWAKTALLSPRTTGGQVAFAVALDPIFVNQAQGSVSVTNVTDAQVQTAVETAINNTILKF